MARNCKMSKFYCPVKLCDNPRHACADCNGIGITADYRLCTHDGTVKLANRVVSSRGDSGGVMSRTSHQLKIIRKV